MMKRISIVSTLALLSALLLAGCSKGIEDETYTTLSFSASVPELIESKATVVTGVTDFYVKGYSGTSQWFPKTASGSNPVNVVLSGGTKEYSEYKWKGGETKTFYAYNNNLPEGVTAGISATGVSLDVESLPSDASDQRDILLGLYEGKGNNKGTAELHFYHPMAALQFTVGTIAALSEITTIEVDGLYSEGSTFLNTETVLTGAGTQQIAQFEWTDCGGYLSASQTCYQTTLTAGAEIGTPFILIPQSFSGNVTLSIYVKMKDGMVRHIIGTLNTGSLIAGKKTLCAISYDGHDVSFNCTIADWSAGQSSKMKVEVYPEGVISLHPFTVSADGKKVYFSKGNLQFRATADGSGTDLSHKTADGSTKQGIWRFAEKQWHTVGDRDCEFGNVYEIMGGARQMCTNTTGFSSIAPPLAEAEEMRRLYTGWVDTFPDCSSGYAVNPWEVFMKDEHYGPGPNYHMNGVTFDATSNSCWEWGYYNAISNGGNIPGLWRTPRRGEMEYLISERALTGFSLGAYNNVNAIKAVVESTPGLIILPDDFSWPEGLEMRFTNSDVYSCGGLFSTTYSASEFAMLEDAGVLFLPECALFCTFVGYSQVSYWNIPYHAGGNMFGSYWECSDEAGMSAQDEQISFQYFGRYKGIIGAQPQRWMSDMHSCMMSVRLVMDVPQN